MTIEDKLKNYILKRYKSIRQFAQAVEMPYSTVDGILKRGILNSGVNNVISVCNALDISADELIAGNISPAKSRIHFRTVLTDLDDAVRYFRMNINECKNFTIGGVPLSEEDAIRILDSMEITIELIRRNNNEEKANYSATRSKYIK